MITGDQTDTASEGELQLLSHAAEALDEVQARIGPRVRRAEVRRRVRRFLGGLLAPVERKNGWQLAEALGERGPHGVQRLLWRGRLGSGGGARRAALVRPGAFGRGRRHPGGR
jgi:hypothetical protein